MTEEKMFCYQCEQAKAGKGCDTMGVCGKDPETALMQDLLVYQAKGVSFYASALRGKGIKNEEADKFVIEALFTTVTNVNFDASNVLENIKEGQTIKEKLSSLYTSKSLPADRIPPQAEWKPSEKLSDLIKFAADNGIMASVKKDGDDITALRELLTYGLKGTAAYADHAMILGQTDDSVFAFFHDALAFLCKEKHSVEELFSWNMKCGEVNLRVMELLDKANTDAYGHPVPTQVRINPVKGKAILVSGHDLKDLEELLKQTEGKGINVYTHGEMLPAHGYPGLKKYKHLVGNYGGAWQDQQKEFKAFPGAILMTTNCIQKPSGYENRIFTSGLVQWPGVKHVDNSDFSPVIKAALSEKGFEKDGKPDTITVGFARNAVISVAPIVIDHVKKGKIKHFFLVGGCDGAKPGRNYYTEFAQKAPKDTVILTLACGKFRFNKMEFGQIEGVPRLLDAGQCNDAYSAIQIALALSRAFGVQVNDLPLSLILSWYEQKAVCILLTLLHLGIKNIRIGPSLPAFMTPAVLKVLIEKFNIIPVKTAEEDLREILKPARA
ncbi:MAG: hydroxylamine reductase [Elusimicrobiota bacterium]